MKRRDWIIVITVVVTAFVVLLTVGLVIGLTTRTGDKEVEVGKDKPTAPEPTAYPLPTPGAQTGLGPYENGVVAADSGVCSEIGRDALKKGGSAVDGAIATTFCIGVINMHSAGIGGGGFMLIYNKAKKSAEVLDYREKAPAEATSDMFSQASSKVGGLATGVPGEVMGMYEAHKKYGKLEWKDLVQPSINLTKYGYKIGIPVYEAMVGQPDYLRKDPGLRQLLMVRDELRELGETITNPQLSITLEKIKENPMSFYNGSLAVEIARDIKRAGGIVTVEDLASYSAKWKEAIRNDLGDLTWYTAPPPASGPVITMILNILKGYNFTPGDRADDEKTSLAYHRIIEAFKYAYAWRTQLGDPDFVNGTAYTNISEIAKKMVKASFADEIRQKIRDNSTSHNIRAYGNFTGTRSHEGTSHISVVAGNGDAVSVTNTINYRFGAKYRSPVTGIIFNNEMDDFSKPRPLDKFGVGPSPSNFIKPGKRPQSSISPVVFTDSNGAVKLVAGASGGKRITTATALVVMQKLWFGKDLSVAVEEPRIHNQVSNTTFESKTRYMLPEAIQNGLRKRGNWVQVSKSYSVVQAISRDENEKLYGKSDPRKHGWAAGY